MLTHDKKSIRNLFVEAILENDTILFKTLLDTIKLSRFYRELLQTKNELGGFTPLQFVCFQGNSALASILINTGSIDIDEKGEFSWTALHAAVFSGDLVTVKLLLNSCADCFARDEHNNLPIDYAGNDKIYNILQATMIEKNIEKFKEITLKNKVPLAKKLATRSASCQIPPREHQILELQEKYSKQKRSSIGSTKELNNLKRWKTYPDLTIDDDEATS